MVGLLLTFLFSTMPNFFSSKAGKYVLIAAAILAAYFYVQYKVYSIDRAGYVRGVLETERKYAEAEAKDKQKTTTQERVIRQVISKKTDADIADILDFWMQPSGEAEGTNPR